MTITRTQFTTAEVCEMTGATPRQLQHWDDKAILRPARDGHRRLYSAEQAELVGKMVKLRDAKISPAEAMRLLSAKAINGQVMVVRGGRVTVVNL